MFSLTTLSKKLWLVKEVIFHKLRVANISDEKELSFKFFPSLHSAPPFQLHKKTLFQTFKKAA